MKLGFRFLWVLLAGTIALLAPAPSSARDGLHFISDVGGRVEIRHRWGGGYRRAYPGDTLAPDDRLRVAPGGWVTVLCDNLSIWRASSGESAVSDGCPTSTTGSASGSGFIRGQVDPATLYLIYPPETTIVTSDTPLQLRWNPIPGATRYRIEIDPPYPMADWVVETEEPEVAYDDVLVPGRAYRVDITAYQSDRALTVSQENDFSVLDRDTEAHVRAEIERLQGEPSLTGEGTVLATVHLYRTHDLYGEAIALLRTWLSTAPPNPAMFELLGDLYREVGLYREAQEAYLQAMEFVGDRVAVRASTRASLGVVLAGLEENEAAIDWYRQAQSDYRELGDEEKVQELQEEIDKL